MINIPYRTSDVLVHPRAAAGRQYFRVAFILAEHQARAKCLSVHLQICAAVSEAADRRLSFHRVCERKKADARRTLMNQLILACDLNPDVECARDR